ncbi:unnamed protein product [Calypogeia fissa]
MTTVKFCKECDNLLYAREDQERRNLVYGCNNCDYEELAESNVVYYKEIRRRGDQRTPVMNPEPVLPVTKSVRCPTCRHGEATFFQAALREEENLTLTFVCTNPSCGHRWHDRDG